MEIEVLMLDGCGIMRMGLDDGGEILDVVDLVFAVREKFAEHGDVEPFRFGRARLRVAGAAGNVV